MSTSLALVIRRSRILGLAWVLRTSVFNARAFAHVSTEKAGAELVRVIDFDGPRGKLMSMPSGGGDKMRNGFWILDSWAACCCGKTYRSEKTTWQFATKEEVVAIIRETRDESQDQWWECYRSHQGELGLLALDGFV